MKDNRIPKQFLYSELAEGKTIEHKPKLKYKDHPDNVGIEFVLTSNECDSKCVSKAIRLPSMAFVHKKPCI